MSTIRRFVVSLGIAAMIGGGGLSLTGCADSFTASETQSVAAEEARSNKVIERYFRTPSSTDPTGTGENTMNTTPSDTTSTDKKGGKG